MTDLGILRADALIPKTDRQYEGPVTIFGYRHVAIITREGDQIRLRIYDGPFTEPTEEERAEHEAWLYRNTEKLMG